MCVFFIFFTPVESNSKCIFHPHRPPLHPTNPPTKHHQNPLVRNERRDMCVTPSSLFLVTSGVIEITYLG